MIETDFCIAISAIISFALGLCVDRKARKERDEEIARLNKEVVTLQNVCESNNDTINRLRRENERLKRREKV